MAEKFRSLLRNLSNDVIKHHLFNNAKATVNNATVKAHERLNNIQNVVATKYDVITKQVNDNITLIQNINATKIEPTPLPKKFVKWWQWYQQLTGLDSVEIAKHQVIVAQDKLFKCQDERRNLNRQATMINEKLKEVYSELIQTRRDDPKYVQLTILENKSLQDQGRIMSELNLLENEEKDHFTMLTTAIKEYHDSQTMYAQKYKYLSIVASAILAIMSLIGSMIYNNKRIANIRDVIGKGQEQNRNTLQTNLHSLEDSVNRKFNEILQRLNNTNNKLVVTPVSHNLDTNEVYNYPNIYVVLGLSAITLFVIKMWTG